LTATPNLAQFHFHTPSEHLENANATPLELHMVFADDADNLLVVGRWINQGSFNSTLDPIFSDLQAQPKPTRSPIST
jgi:carbonic anhydrase